MTNDISAPSVSRFAGFPRENGRQLRLSRLDSLSVSKSVSPSICPSIRPSVRQAVSRPGGCHSGLPRPCQARPSGLGQEQRRSVATPLAGLTLPVLATSSLPRHRPAPARRESQKRRARPAFQRDKYDAHSIEDGSSATVARTSTSSVINSTVAIVDITSKVTTTTATIATAIVIAVVVAGGRRTAAAAAAAYSHHSQVI